MTHELKIWPQYFQPVLDGKKTFEHRINDRGFQPGDLVVLREFSTEKVRHTDGHNLETWEWFEERGYTGRELRFIIGYILPVQNDFVVFSLIKQPEVSA